MSVQLKNKGYLQFNGVNEDPTGLLARAGNKLLQLFDTPPSDVTLHIGDLMLVFLCTDPELARGTMLHIDWLRAASACVALNVSGDPKVRGLCGGLCEAVCAVCCLPRSPARAPAPHIPAPDCSGRCPRARWRCG